ncbi:hypothetical protein PIROE2DRAFT_15964 [Piromyces sp. E2]|nr:hypothetical protein PIROE2DRAFT_15964 [Piromyces sp. E2]|eukprot:OUM58699.1 hypothetical protein PIROE2DRAFT_15964 [Piromyces sp. E2]
MSSNKKAFKQATISSFFKTPKTKEVVNETPSYTNVNLSQFKKVQESKGRNKRVAPEEVETNNSEQNSNVSFPNKRRNIYRSYHNALQKFKFSTVNQKPIDNNNTNTTATAMDIDNNTLTTPSKKSSIGIEDLSKFSSSISSTSSPAQSPSKPQKKIVYTPLEQQYLEIKKNNPNMLLAIEVGYKYRFFDNDALVVSKVLGITCYRDHNFYSAVVPVHRLMIHLRK